MSLNWRERSALRHSAAGFFEDPAEFPRGVGGPTLASLHARGFLEYGTDPTYGKVGYRTTHAGKAALYGDS